MFSFVRWAVLAFSLVLAWAGLVPLIHPDSAAPTSMAPDLAWFHLFFSLLGFASFAVKKGAWAPWFAVGFGAIDLYQALASASGWFPIHEFRWTSLDNTIHWIVGTALVVLGLLGRLRRKAR